MSKTCDLCGVKTGLFGSFRCQDGVVCKQCYRIVSRQYAETISGMTLLELKKRYVQNAQPLDLGGDGFQPTRRIGSYLLLDETGGKLCLLNNQKLSGGNGRPEIYPCAALESVRLRSEPELSPERLSALAGEKRGGLTVQKLAVRLRLKDVGTREIVVIPTPVRTSSFAFRQAWKVAGELLDCLTPLCRAD